MKIGVTGSHGLIGKRICEMIGAESIDRSLLDVVTADLRYDIIIHCAAYGNHSNQVDEDEMFKANVVGTYNLLKSARASGVKTFINIGSSSEYGTKDTDMSEDMLPETNTMYGCTKVCGTYLARRYSQFMNIVTVRPFSVYGEEEAEWRFIPTVIRKLLNSEELNLLEGYHDWIYVDDFVNGVLRVIEHIKELNGQVVNIGTGFEYSNEFIVKALEKISGKSVTINLGPRKYQDSYTWKANISKLVDLGWEQKVDIIEGLNRVYEYKTRGFTQK